MNKNEMNITCTFIIIILICSKWSKDTHDFFLKLWQNGDGYEAGVCLIPVIVLTTEANGINAPWRDIVFKCMDLNAESIERFSEEQQRNYK